MIRITIYKHLIIKLLKTIYFVPDKLFFKKNINNAFLLISNHC
jgi:hypothetical protein